MNGEIMQTTLKYLFVTLAFINGKQQILDIIIIFFFF